jgi:hypothetical protein
MDTGSSDVQKIQQRMFDVNKRIAAKRQQLSKLKGCGASAKFSVKALQKDIDSDTHQLFELQRALASVAPASTPSYASPSAPSHANSAPSY